MRHSVRVFAALLFLASPLPAAGPGEAGVTYLPGAHVEEAFLKGVPLVETDGYKVHASRRDAPGQAEVHEKDTDIVYVLTGSATLVTGGSLDGSRRIGPEELRGDALRGGTARPLHRGDVVIVPAGTPHWFREVSGPFTYYVVKVRS